MNSIINPHDKYFKGAMKFKKVAEEFFKQYLPLSLKNQLDFSSLQLCSESFVDEKLKTLMSDILYRVTIAGRESYIYIMVEHQSSPDNFMAFRVLQYMVAIWAQHLKAKSNTLLPLIVPLVFYHGQATYHATQDIKQLIDASPELIEEYLFAPYQLINVHEMNDADLGNQAYISMLTLLMKHVHTRDFLFALEKTQPHFQALEKYGENSYIRLSIHYLLEAYEIGDKNTALQHLEQTMTVTSEEIMTLAEHLRIEGFQEGIKQGIERGIEQGIERGIERGWAKGVDQGKALGEYAILLKQLMHKFGEIPLHYEQLLQAADEAQLLLWAERLLDAQTINEIFNAETILIA